MSALSTIVQSTLAWTGRASLQVSVLVILVLVLQRLLGRRLTPRLRYALSFLVLCRLLLPITPSSSLSLENLFIQAPQPVQSAPLPTMPAKFIPGSVRFAPAHGLSLESALPIAWLCGLLVLVGLAVWRYAQWRRTIRTARRVRDPRLLQILDQARQEMGIRRPVTLTSLPDIGSPAVFGFWRLHVLLPEATFGLLTEPEWRLVFLHEMTHVRNGDTVLNAILIGVQFVHWFNPFVWIGLKRLRADRELVCDATVVEQLEPGERLGYARVLLRLAEAITDGAPVFPSAVPVVSNASEIRERVIAIKRYGKSGRTARMATVASVLLLGFLTFTRARERDISPTAPGVMTIFIDKDGALRFGKPQNPVTLDGLRAALASAKLRKQEVGLVIVADRSAPYDQVIKVMDLARYFKVTARTEPDGNGDPLSVESARSREAPSGASATNGALVTHGTTTISADRITAYPRESKVIAEGHVHLGQSDQEWVGDHVAWNGGMNQIRSQQKVSGIEVKYIGPPSVNQTEVRHRIRTQVGQAYKPADIDADVRSLYATGLFYNIRVAVQFSANGTELVYSVQCNPRLTNIAFTGNSKFNDAQLRKLIKARVGDVFNERKLFSDAQSIRSAYENAGLNGAGAKYTYAIDEQSGKASVTFEITEKP